MNGLTYIRTRCNISQSELADILQVSKQAISMWENGKKEISAGGISFSPGGWSHILVGDTDAFSAGGRAEF